MLAAYSAKRNQEEGFTLIELLIVVIIIGILAAIALPIFIDQQKVAVDASVKSDVRNTVTNITNAQAQQQDTAKAAVSNADTKVALTAVGRNAAANSAPTTVTATKTSLDLTNVPALGGLYTVDGYNAGGKKYQGTADNPAWDFSSATGNFTQGNDVAPGAGTGTGGSGGSGDSEDESDAYYGSFNSAAFKAAYINSGASYTQMSLSGGSYGDAKTFYKGSGPTNVSGAPLLSGLDYDGGSGTIGDNYDGKAVTNVKFYDADGSVIDSLTGAFADGDCTVSYLIQDAATYGDAANHPKGGAEIHLNCNGSTGANLAQADANKLLGGKVTFIDANGDSNTLRYSGGANQLTFQKTAAPYNRGYGSGGNTPSSYSQNDDDTEGTAQFATYIDSEGSDDTPYQVHSSRATFTGQDITTINASNTDSALPSATFNFGPAPVVAEGEEPPSSIRETKSYPITITAMYAPNGTEITPSSTTGVIQIAANSPWFATVDGERYLQGAQVRYEVRVPDTNSDGDSIYRQTAKVDFTLDSDGSAHSVVFSR